MAWPNHSIQGKGNRVWRRSAGSRVPMRACAGCLTISSMVLTKQKPGAFHAGLCLLAVSISALLTDDGESSDMFVRF